MVYNPAKQKRCGSSSCSILIVKLVETPEAEILKTEQAGLELFSGCLGLFALLFVGIGTRVMRRMRTGSENRRLNGLLTDFVTEADQSLVNVNQIQAMLMTTFAHNREDEELASAIASFAPGAVAPFHNEAWLANELCAFLRKRRIVCTRAR